MTIELTEDTIGVWYMKIAEDQDWLAALNQVDDGLRFTYRFRYYKDDKVWDSKDVKKWYDGVIHDQPLEKVLSVIRGLVKHMRELDYGNNIPDEDCYELMMDDAGLDVFMTRFSQFPSSNTMQVLFDHDEDD